MASAEHDSMPTSEEVPSSRDRSGESSGQASRSGTKPLKKTARIHWQSEGESIDSKKQRSTFNVRDESTSPPKLENRKPLPRARSDLAQARPFSQLATPSSPESFSGNVSEAPKRASPRLSILRQSSQGSDDNNDGDEATQDEFSVGKKIAQRTAQTRAQQLSRDLGIKSAPGSKYTSPVSSPPPSPPPEEQYKTSIDFESIPLETLQTKRRRYGIEDDTDSEGSGGEESQQKHNRFYRAAKRLIKGHRVQNAKNLFRTPAMSSQSSLHSGQTTPEADRDLTNYVPRPKAYREGVLSSILKLYNEQGVGAAASHSLQRVRSSIHDSSPDSLLGSGPASPLSSGHATPEEKKASGKETPRHQKWYYKQPSPTSSPSIANLVSSSRSLAQPTAAPLTKAEESSEPVHGRKAGMRPEPRPKPAKRGSTQALHSIFRKALSVGPEDPIKIQLHVADVLKRHKYLLKLCKALISYGTPSHRLEEAMRMSARVLEVDGQFLYIPGCMIISFDDSGTHTTEVRIVRTSQGVNLGKLNDTHEVYKEVIHDRIDLDEAMTRLDEIVRGKDRYPPWLLVIVYGLASACVGPFAFGARPIDLPIAFLLGAFLGILQLVLTPRSELYSNISEISAAVLTSFLARAFGSIRNGELFCFSALAQSAIALILPGYIVLCGSLELQSRNIVAGSVRIVYAVIYSLFLGFGITIGTSFYGLMSSKATSDITCRTSMPIWFPFIFVPPFTLCLIVINQGRFKQMPAMLVIAFAGYVVNHFSAKRFASNAQIANTLGALTVGVLGNLYSRLRHGVAATALLPAIFVQVPSGLAASGSLVSGVASANQLTNQTVNGTLATGTTTVSQGGRGGLAGDGNVNSMVLNVGYSMIQIAIGITVGLFLSALIVYPTGKRRSGLFSF